MADPWQYSGHILYRITANGNDRSALAVLDNLPFWRVPNAQIQAEFAQRGLAFNQLPANARTHWWEVSGQLFRGANNDTTHLTHLRPHMCTCESNTYETGLTRIAGNVEVCKHVLLLRRLGL